jgi:Kef-type K+ transport system membrane component KefB
MVESGLSNTDLGKLILAACFVTDLGAVVALGVLFASFNLWMGVFVVVTALVLWKLQKVTRWVISHWGSRVSEPEIKLIFLVLFFLGGLSTTAKSEAVLPAYLVGLAIAGVFVRDKVLVQRMRSIAFTMLTPFFFIKAGTFISLPALLAGLTFGSISALYGLTNGIIDQTQYTVLVTVVVGSAVVPTLIAQTWFLPAREHAGVMMPLETASAPTQDHEHLPGAPTIAPVGNTEEASMRSQGDCAS